MLCTCTSMYIVHVPSSHHMYVHKNTHRHEHNTDMRTHTHTHTHTHTRTRTHTHTHTHTSPSTHCFCSGRKDSLFIKFLSTLRILVRLQASLCVSCSISRCTCSSVHCHSTCHTGIIVGEATSVFSGETDVCCVELNRRVCLCVCV